MTSAVPLRMRGLEVATLSACRRLLGRPVLLRGARALSFAGEHAGGWLLLGGVAALRGSRRREWATGATGVLLAHASAVAAKQVVRRVRPDLPHVPPLVRTPSRMSFPSAHATSTAAAAYGYAPMVGTAVPAGVVLAMGASRLLLGVHWPSDVLAGSALGLAVAAAVRRFGRSRAAAAGSGPVQERGAPAPGSTSA